MIPYQWTMDLRFLYDTLIACRKAISIDYIAMGCSEYEYLSLHFVTFYTLAKRDKSHQQWPRLCVYPLELDIIKSNHFETLGRPSSQLPPLSQAVALVKSKHASPSV